MGKNGIIILQISFIILAIIGGWFGFSYISQVSAQAGGGFLWILAVIFTTIVSLIAGVVLNVVLHECGHVIGGVFTGYRFVFYSALGLAIIKEKGKLVVKKYLAPGSGGGCLLSPPDIKNGTYPHKLYISGGFLVNFLVSAICFSLFYHLAATAPFGARAFLVAGIAGAFLGLVNLIPHNISAPSDGYILFNMGKEKNTALRRGLWSCFRFQALIAEGKRPQDIPTELLDWVVIENIKDPFVFGTACNRYRYLLDRQELNEARTLMQTLSNKLNDLPDVLKLSCHCELLFLELIGECRQEEIDRLYTKELKGYIKAAHAEIEVRRLMYAYSRLVLKDAGKIKENLDLFHKAIAIPIQSGFALGEQELITLIDTIADKNVAMC